MHFKDTNLATSLLKQLTKIGFDTPTPIQEKTIPIILEGKDIIGTAQTGTGKTGAFGIPLISNLITSDKFNALILLPTRELAMQVKKTLESFMPDSLKIKATLIIGGENIIYQCKQLKLNSRLIIGTPGRINDHLTRGSLKLNKVNFLVLDEFDRMLDMGFERQLHTIVNCITSEHQTLMFSATFPESVKKLSKKYVQNPVNIAIGNTNSPIENVTQINIKVSDENKYDKLLEELNNREGSILIFVKTKYKADRLTVKLKNLEYKAESLHGGLRQTRRSSIIGKFQKGTCQILIATDIAARGLDIPHIKHVINYDMPQCTDDYIHRIGRTGRANSEGDALNFIDANEYNKWKKILNIINDKSNTKDNIKTVENIKRKVNNPDSRTKKPSFKKNNRKKFKTSYNKP